MTSFKSHQRHKTVLCLCSFMLLPFLFGFFDNIAVVAIRDMQLRQEAGQYILDTVIVIQNTNANTLKLENCALEVALALDDTQAIPLGSANIDEILLVAQTGEADSSSGTDVRLAINLGSNIQELQRAMLSNPEFLRVLTMAKPQLSLTLKGTFDMGVKTEQFWSYQNGLRIDWLITPDISRSILAAAFASIAPGLTENTSLPVEPQNDVPPQSLQEANQVPRTMALLDLSGENRCPAENTLCRIEFQTKTEINAGEVQDLKNWAEKQMRSMPETMILHIQGHTDIRGSAEGNQAWSEKRAETIYHYLVEAGHTWNHVILEGFGETRPIFPDAEETYKKNRRADLFFSAD